MLTYSQISLFLAEILDLRVFSSYWGSCTPSHHTKNASDLIASAVFLIVRNRESARLRIVKRSVLPSSTCRFHVTQSKPPCYFVDVDKQPKIYMEMQKTKIKTQYEGEQSRRAGAAGLPTWFIFELLCLLHMWFQRIVHVRCDRNLTLSMIVWRQNPCGDHISECITKLRLRSMTFNTKILFLAHWGHTSSRAHWGTHAHPGTVGAHICLGTLGVHAHLGTVGYACPP